MNSARSNPSLPSEEEAVRGALVAALGLHFNNSTIYSDGVILRGCTCGAEVEDFGEHQADIVLDTLGLEQVGWTFLPLQDTPSDDIPGSRVRGVIYDHPAPSVTNVRAVPIYTAALSASTDPEPQPSDGPDYHADHAAWTARQSASLGADVVIDRNEDGSYTCTCGSRLPDAVALASHRRSYCEARLSASSVRATSGDAGAHDATRDEAGPA